MYVIQIATQLFKMMVSESVLWLDPFIAWCALSKLEAIINVECF